MSATATTRNLIGPILRAGYRVRVTGGHDCPRHGSLLIVAEHVGILDATVIATSLPRPVDVLVEPGVIGLIAARTPGRIAVDPASPVAALHQATDLLRHGRAVGAWSGDGHEMAAGYLQVRACCPVLPVAIFGSHGRRPTDPPPWRSVIDIVVGSPFLPDATGDPFARSTVLHAAEVIRQRVADHVETARRRTGRADGVGLRPGGADPDNGRL